MIEGKFFTIRRRVLSLLGSKMDITNEHGQTVGFSKSKVFALKEAITIYTDENEQSALLSIQARNILDLAATYDVVDRMQDVKVGALRRKGLRSILQDEWVLLDAQDQEIGLIKEDGLFLALIRRFILSLIPQNFQITIQGVAAGTIQSTANPFVNKLTIDLRNGQASVDARLIVAAGILLNVIEGKQN